MAINKKGSRKIVVDGHEFRWRATGNDGWITLVLWPVENEDSRLVGQIKYHSNIVQTDEGWRSATDQAVITNRMVKQVILHHGVDAVLRNKGQINIGSIKKIYDIENAVRGRHGASQ